MPIAFDQPPWFTEHAVEPLQPEGLQPPGSSAFFAGQKIDGGTDTQGHVGSDLRLVGGHPELLFGGPQTDDQDLRLGDRDLLQDFLIFFG